MCALGGAVFAQYQMYIGPDTIAGLGLSLNIVFAVIAGGMWVLLGPTVGAVFTQMLAESLRVVIQGSTTLKSLLGSSALALDQMIYGLLLVLFIIYMPKGILGTGTDWWRRWRKRKAKSARLEHRARPCYPAGRQPRDPHHMLTLRQIEVIRAIMITGSVGGAARLLNVSSPGISRVMKHAEGLLGLKLFSRKGGRYTPTREASDIFSQINGVYDKVEDLEFVIRRLKRGADLELKIGSVPSISNVMVPRAIADVRAQVSQPADRRRHPQDRGGHRLSPARQGRGGRRQPQARASRCSPSSRWRRGGSSASSRKAIRWRGASRSRPTRSSNTP